MNNLTTIKGTVEEFERSTHTSGTTQYTSTAHLSMFRIGQQRVILKTTIPSVISNGDEVILAGTTANGQFHAFACRNMTANWVSPLKQQGCAFSALICMAVVSFILFFLVFPIVFGGVCIFFAVKIRKSDHTLKLAHQMIQNAEPTG